jgi:outer membrane lipoprotein carrier protein
LYPNPHDRRDRERRCGDPLTLLFALALLLGPAAGRLRATACELVKDYLRGLNSLQADFRQITLAADGGEMIESSGTFYLLRPNRFRWDYETPSEQLIVADGKRIYVYDKELNQVTTAARRRSSTAPRRSCWRATSRRKVLHHAQHRPRRWRTWAELVPKTAETDVEKLQIGFVDGELDTLVMEDRFGQLTRFIFHRPRPQPTAPVRHVPLQATPSLEVNVAACSRV